MKISIIGTRGIPASYGGFETFAEEIAMRLTRESIDVTVVCQAVKIKKGFSGDVILRYSKYTKDSEPVRFYWDSLKMASLNADIILVCGVGGAIFYPFLKNKNARIITHVDGREELRGKYSALKKMYVRISQFFAAKYSDHIVADSHAVKKFWKKKYSLDGSKITTIEFGAYLTSGEVRHLNEWDLKPEEYYLVVCRMVPENNPDMIIKGFAAAGSERKLILVGDVTGRYRESLLRFASHKIIFLNGIYDKEKLSALRKNCFAYIHGHSVGGTNPSLLESMGAGKVCICHNNEFNRETTANGMIYFEDSAELANKIRSLEAMDESAKRNLETAGMQRISSIYNWEKITEKYLHLFDISRHERRKFQLRTFRPEQNESVTALASFLRNEYPSGEISGEKYLEWEYQNNPAGKAIITTAQNEASKIVSQYALTPVTIQEGDHTVLATLSLNTLTAKGYRGKGLFIDTANDAYKYCSGNRIAFTYGIPNGNSFSGFVRRLDFNHPGNLVFMVKPLNFWNLGMSILRRKKFKKGNAIDSVLDTTLMEKSGVSELIFPDDEELYKDFLQKWSSKGFISVHKTPSYLSWRYIQNPLRKYRMLKLVTAGEMKGMVVIRTMHLYGLKVCLIMDHLSLDKSSTAILVELVSKQAKLNQLDLIVAVSASKRNSQYDQLIHAGLKSIPAILLPQQLPFITRIHNDHSHWQKKVNNLRNWHFTFGDYDVF